jgi:hypothetical protein
MLYLHFHDFGRLCLVGYPGKDEFIGLIRFIPKPVFGEGNIKEGDCRSFQTSLDLCFNAAFPDIDVVNDERVLSTVGDEGV